MKITDQIANDSQSKLFNRHCYRNNFRLVIISNNGHKHKNVFVAEGIKGILEITCYLKCKTYIFSAISTVCH